MKHFTKEQRDAIVKRYKAGDPLKVIAHDFGTYAAYVSALARKRGLPSRYQFQQRVVAVRLRVQEHEELRRLAKEQRVKPRVIAREAIAAYLGLIR